MKELWLAAWETILSVPAPFAGCGKLRWSPITLQTDREHPTGTVNVQLDTNGIAQYEISHPVAWDFLDWTNDWRDLASTADAICFGSLAQRSEASRATIQKFLKAAPSGTLKVFDVNLRQSFYSAVIITESIRLADIVKLNDEELPKVMDSLGIPHQNELSSAQKLIRECDLKLVCITRGGRGSLLVRDGESNSHPGFKVRVADTIGSGDAFTAAMVHEYLQGSKLERMNEVANRVGAWVASEPGAMPIPKQGALAWSLSELR